MKGSEMVKSLISQGGFIWSWTACDMKQKSARFGPDWVVQASAQSGCTVAGDLMVVTVAIQVYRDRIPVKANTSDESLSHQR